MSQTVFMVLSVLAGVIGVFSLSNATSGVGAIAMACWLAIMARMSQANAHHKSQLDAMDKIAKQQAAEYEQKRTQEP